MKISNSLLSLVLLMGLAAAAPAQNKNHQSQNSTQRIVPGTVIVKFREFTYASSQARTDQRNPLSSLSFEVKSSEGVFKNLISHSRGRTVTKSGIDFTRYGRITIDKSLDVHQAIRELEQLPGVEYAEPVYLYSTSYTPDDPQAGSQAHLDVINAFEAWDVTKGSSGVVVAVIDAGVDYEHEDLADKIYLNEDEIPGNSLDDDNDGYIDNYYGWDFAGDDYQDVVQDNDPLARASNIDHGTSVAGCAAASTDNGTGVAGTGFDAKYLAVKCSSDNDTRDNGSAYLFNTDLAVIYAVDQGADVINMSFGGTAYSQFSQDVMTYAAVEHDVVLVAAAGNSGTDVVQYPAGYEHVLAVANTTNTDVKASSSSYGDWVDLSAPGTSILTTGINDTYVNISGTSFSAPITAGAAALLRAYHPDYQEYQIRQLLIQTADNIDAKNPNFAGELGKGRLNMHRALTESTPAIKISAFSITNASGEVPSKGETAYMKLTLVNLLSPSSSATTLTISEASGITLDSMSTVEIGVIGTDEEKTYDPFTTLVIPETVSYNEELEFKIVVNDPVTGFDYDFLYTVSVNPIATDHRPLPYLKENGGDFESNPDDFVSGPLSGGTNLWELGVPSNELEVVNSGTKAWKTDLDANLLKATYTCVLQSPVFDFTEESKEYVLSFYKSMESEFCNAPAAVQLQYSFDQVSWYRLGSKDDVEGTNWYNKDINSACQINASIFGDQEGWLGNFSNEYTAYDVSFLAGSSEVSFRFLLSVNGDFDGAINDDGFMIDDFQVEVLSPDASFYAPKTVNFVGQAVAFKYLSHGADTFSWDFGDGGTSDEQDPHHIYESPGLYDVSLSITSADGSSDSTRSGYLLVLPALQVPFAGSHGGDFEDNQAYFGVENVAGTPFELGQSAISGKSGTSSGDFAWVTGIEELTYQDESEAYLYSPEFDFSYLGPYQLSFKANYSFEVAWDGFVVEYSVDKGSSWTKLNDKVEAGWYDMISDPSSVFGESVPLFSGSTNGAFVTKSADVTFLAGEPNVAFRFRFLTDAATVDAGLAIDDFTLTGPGPGVVNASFEAELVDGSVGCQSSMLEFTSTSTGGVVSLEWDFGNGATPATASGIGPVEVIFATIGANTVTLVATDTSGATFQKDTVIQISALHTPEITSVINEDGTYTLTVTEGDSFQWYLNGTLMEGATGRSYVAVTNGDYSVEVNVDGCIRIGMLNDLIVLGAPGTDPAICLFPNPTRSTLIIEGLSPYRTLSWYLLDMSGKKVTLSTEAALQGDHYQIDTSSLGAGQYLFVGMLDDKVLIKEKVLKIE